MANRLQLAASLAHLVRAWRKPDSLLLAIIVFGAILRFCHFHDAHFQLDQAMLARIAWDLAREGIFPTHMWHLSGGYANFPLASYLHAPVLLLSSDIRALLLWNIALNLGALSLCAFFVRRYWGWQAAAIASLLLASAPWDVFYAHRLWTNAMMPFFVMLWALSLAFAYQERRARWWLPGWLAALWLLQLHPSGIIFPVISAILSLALWLEARRLPIKPMAAGLAAGLLPALPWLGVHLSGAVPVLLERTPFLDEGRRNLVYNWNLLVDFLAGRNLGNWFRGAGLADLQAQFAPLDALAPAIIAFLALSGLCALYGAFRGRKRRLYRMLALWLLLPLAYPALTFYYSQTMVYFLPLLPAPFIAAGALYARLPSRLRPACAALALLICALNANAIWQSAAFVRAGVMADDPTIWAVGGGAPLSTQLEIARAAQDAMDARPGDELIAVMRPVLTMADEHLYHALPVFLPEAAIRFLDTRAPNFVFPARDSLILIDDRQTSLPPQYAAAKALTHSTRFRLYHLPIAARPTPDNMLPSRPAFEAGVRLLGYDDLRCAGGGRLHWTPDEAFAASHSLHFFINLLDEDGGVLAQNDLLALEPRYWRSGDHVVTEFDFGQPVADLPVMTLRVGMYYWLGEAGLQNVYALDEEGRPWLYAVDIAYDNPCSP